MINKKIKIIFIFLLLFLFSCKDNNYQLIYEEKIPSVVEITVYGKNIFGGLSKFSSGSGFVWDNNGNILISTGQSGNFIELNNSDEIVSHGVVEEISGSSSINRIMKLESKEIDQ